MSIDLQGYSTTELDKIITQAKKRKTALKKRKPVATVRAKISAAAEAEGYTIAELFGGRTAKATTARKPGKNATTRKPRKKTVRKGRKLGKVPPKYRNPAKKSETWTGRGKPPRWMAPLLKKGKKKEDFLIKK